MAIYIFYWFKLSYHHYNYYITDAYNVIKGMHAITAWALPQ